MTNKEILLKAIDKAEQNGWECPFEYIYEVDIESLDENSIEHFDGEKFIRYTVSEIIFNHYFAKAFWGEKKVTIANEPEETYGNVPRYKCQHWEYQLQRLVLEKEQLQYIKKFL
ncbi:MAG: hypothetical protein ACTSWD_09520 [Candidatus Heimdallarchaeota archaeon]